jgi:hypothetical protein
MKLKLEIEVEYDAETMHGNDPDSMEWFRDAVLLNPAKDERLILHSNCIGDEIGEVRVTRIISGLSNDKAQVRTK